jgi:hypothetical protein
MELALQVVGLKMTGKIEDAKNVAMRIVGGGAGPDNQSSQNGNGASNLMQMQLASSSSSTSPQSIQVQTQVPHSFNRDFRSLLFIRAGETENFESTVIDFLSILDTPLDSSSAPRAILTSHAISHPTTSTGQTLLHLAAFMKLPALVSFLVEHDADVDVRDKNGFTPLHFAVMAKSEECAKTLVRAGADMEIVNYLGKTAEEIAAPGFFDNILPHEESGGDDGDVESEIDDEEAEWGDAEEDDGSGEDNEVKIRRLLRRRASKRAMRKSANASVNASGRGTPRRSVDVSRAATPPPPPHPPLSSTSAPLPPKQQSPENPKPSDPPSTPEKSDLVGVGVDADAKQTASIFVLLDLIQRTLAQLPRVPPATGILPKNLPKPQLPGLPNLPDFNMPYWNALNALPQIPVVFPVIVSPTTGWPSLTFLGNASEENGENEKGEKKPKPKDGDGDGEEAVVGGGETKAPPNVREWKAMWEKWLALAIATTAKQQQQQQGQVQDVEDVPPPEYTPRAEDIPIANNATKDTPSQKAKGKAKASSVVTATTTPGQGADDKEVIRSEALIKTTNAGAPGPSRIHAHPVGYDDTPVPAEEVDAYTYQPPVKQKQKHKKRESSSALFLILLS